MHGCVKSSAYALGTEIRGGNFKQVWDTQGDGEFATDSQGPLRTSDGDPRTRTFPQTRPTVGDTACSVKGI